MTKKMCSTFRSEGPVGLGINSKVCEMGSVELGIEIRWCVALGHTARI